MSINNFVVKIKATGVIIKQCYNEMKASADNLRIRILEVWKKQKEVL